MTKLLKKIIYTGNLVVKTGLHIGGTNASLNIGGPDKFVVRNPLTNIPYIPGSSLKGKLRSLLELKNGETSDGKPSNNIKSKAGALFGVAGDNKQSHPSRLIVRDAEMATDADTEEELQKYGLSRKMLPDYSNTDLHSKRIPDFVKLADAYGCVGLRVEHASDVEATIKKAREINDQPVLIDFNVSRDAMVWPMVAAGVSNDDIQYAQGISPAWDREDLEDPAP